MICLLAAQLSGSRRPLIALSAALTLALLGSRTGTFARVPNPMAAPLQLTAVRMADARTGWGVANNLVFRTADGGHSWLDVTPAGVPRQHELVAAFVTDLVARIGVTSTTETSSITVFRTADGGGHWLGTRLSGPRGGVEPGQRLTFPDPQHGWLLVNLGVGAGQNPYQLLRTVDGGGHWSLVAQSGPQGTSRGAFAGCDCTFAITFRDAFTGWSTGRVFATPQPDWLYTSHDSGRTWRNQTLSTPPGYSVTETDAPTFFGHGRGIMPVQLVTRSLVFDFDVYVTGDGGASWRPTAPITLGQDPYTAVSVVDPQRGWVANGSNLYRTSDGGRSWTFRRRALSFAAQQLDFISKSTGFAVSRDPCGPGCRPHLLKTTDGGRTWRPVYTVSLARPLHG